MTVWLREPSWCCVMWPVIFSFHFLHFPIKLLYVALYEDSMLRSFRKLVHWPILKLNSRLHSVKHTSRYCFHKRLKRSRSLARILQGSLRTNSPCNYHSKTKNLILCLYTSLISHWRSVIVDLNIFDSKLLTCRITSPMPWELFFRLQHRPSDKRVPFSENKYV